MATQDRTGWAETEVRATVEAYFELLRAQENNDPITKTSVYGQLSQLFGRSPKAFEAKFQNISAILYEQNLPYCDGLSPRFNYQRLLRLMVLDYIDRVPVPTKEPHEILFQKLKGLAKKGFLPVKGGGSGRYGLAVEHALSIPQNSNKAPDFMGIELKTKFQSTLQTLFSRTPTRYLGFADRGAFLDAHGYVDAKRNRLALYTSFTSQPDSFGFRLTVENGRIVVVREDTPVLEYDLEALEEALLSKHTQTAYIELITMKHDGIEHCSIVNAIYCKWPSILRFQKLVSEGRIHLDFTLARKNGKTTDHGFLWRIESDRVSELYLHTDVRPMLVPEPARARSKHK